MLYICEQGILYGDAIVQAHGERHDVSSQIHVQGSRPATNLGLFPVPAAVVRGPARAGLGDSVAGERERSRCEYRHVGKKVHGRVGIQRAVHPVAEEVRGIVHA